jgi:hypothetical protein
MQAEIRRFLRSPDPEVLCVTGAWGVGKTYTWQKILRESQSKKSVGLARYSYTSLFGINSLEGLKLSIFENLEFLDAPPANVLEKATHGAKSIAALAKKLGGAVSALPYVGDFLSKAGPLYFSLIGGQIICIDDLERRGAGLNVKDVFGLISFLREQRACKVILLLNADALDDGKADFDNLFEKVIDTRLVFAPSAREAVAIALTGHDKITETLRLSCETLSIANIRVIKKIERLSRQIEPLLKGFAPEVLTSAIRSIVMFGWAKFQPDQAPSLDYIRGDTMVRYINRKNSKTEPTAKEKEFLPDVELIEAARSYDPDKIKKLADVAVDEYYRLLKAKRGDDLRIFVLAALEFRRIANASPEMREVIRRMSEALRRVASESTLNAIRVRKYGVDIREA